MPTVRKSTDADSANSAQETAPLSVAGVRRKSYTPSKKELGKVTPKRVPYGKAAEPPPANKREAATRSRQKQRDARMEARAGMMAGKEEFLLPRDKGPERRLVRDIVDSRRNVASLFLPVALVVVIGAYGTMPPAIRVASNVLWFALAAGVIVDSFLLTRRIKELMSDRMPKALPRKHYWYGIFRSLNLRRMRIPTPQVKSGDKI